MVLLVQNSGPILVQVLRTVSEMEDDREASHELPNHEEKTIPPISTEETDGERNCSCCVLILYTYILQSNRDFGLQYLQLLLGISAWIQNSLHPSLFLSAPESKEIFPTYTGMLDGPFY